MSPTTYTPPLPGLGANDTLGTVINWGAGADSTAYIAKMLTAPDAHESTSTAPPSSTWPPAASGLKPGSWQTSS
ncbi:hypothetical protein [Streptomyces antibioticus]|uniref:hypothetical protein n=1 Tax=Streptomyces antibioticus TaxID=1890 RepID=UPI0036DEFE24